MFNSAWSFYYLNYYVITTKLQHNNEPSDLHKDCTYIFNETLFKITDLSYYPKVTITDNAGNSMTVDAYDIFHMELTNTYLDGISDRIMVSVTVLNISIFTMKFLSD